ncbi:MAG: IS1182 family transposase [Candidatus Acidiferrum sp.]
MATRFVVIDRQTPMFLPPALQEWVAENDLAKFVLEAVELSDLRTAAVNVRGSGSEQYPPSMMMGLILYSYATGLFSSRRIERSTYDSIAARYLCANTHPDHDTIASFRRNNGALVRSCFVEVLELARESGLVKLGTVSLDGSKFGASASKRRTVSGDQLEAQITALEREVCERIRQAELADLSGAEDGYSLPESHGSAERRLAKLKEAKARLAEREAKKKKKRREKEEPPDKPPSSPLESKRGGRAQINLSDSESALMPTHAGPFLQGYNAQAAIDGDGAGLIVGAHVVNATNDRQQLLAGVEAIPAQLGRPKSLLADTGYDNASQIMQVEAGGETLVYCKPQGRGGALACKTYRLSAQREVCSQVRQKMRERLAQAEGVRLYARRQVLSEAPFHVIKNLMGFRRFSMRGLEKVNLEWLLVALAYNCRKMVAARIGIC